MKSRESPDVQAAILAVHLGMIEEAEQILIGSVQMYGLCRNHGCTSLHDRGGRTDSDRYSTGVQYIWQIKERGDI